MKKSIEKKTKGKYAESISLEKNSEHVTFLFLNFTLFLSGLYWEYIVPGCSHVGMASFFLSYFIPLDGNY